MRDYRPNIQSRFKEAGDAIPGIEQTSSRHAVDPNALEDDFWSFIGEESDDSLAVTFGEP